MQQGPQYAPPAGGGALTPATADTLGGIKVGAGLAVAADGTTSNAAPAPNALIKITESGTWTAPRAGVYRITCVGGGGGGGGASGQTYAMSGFGGGGGGTSVVYATLAAGDELTVAIGAGGAAGADGTSTSHPGGAGGTTSITMRGTELCRATGGAGGPSPSNSAAEPAPGGEGNCFNGGAGTAGDSHASTTTVCYGGAGGWPNGGNGGNASAAHGAATAGGAGWVIIEYWTPAS